MPTLWGNKSGWAAKINSLDEKHPKAVSLYSTPNPSHLEKSNIQVNIIFDKLTI